MLALLDKAIDLIRRVRFAGLFDGDFLSPTTDSLDNMAARPPSIFSLFIINKAGGLIYQKNYAGSRRLPFMAVLP